MQILRVLLLLLILSDIYAAESQEKARIALLYDGQAIHEESFSHLVQKEVLNLLYGEFEVEFLTIKDLWSMQGTFDNVWGALNDPRVDLVITLGFMSSFQMLQMQQIMKPVVVGYNLNYFTQPGISIPILKSPRLAYYQSQLTLSSEIKIFAEITHARTLAFIGDASLIGNPDFSIIIEKIQEAAENAGIVPIFLPVTQNGRSAIQGLDEVSVEGVVYLPTWRMPKKAFQALIDEVNSRYLPSFSILGEEEVNQGVLMTLTPNKEITRAARRIALDAQELLISGTNQEIVRDFSRSHEMIINERTSQAIKWDIPWGIQRNATFVDQVPPNPTEMIAIADAAYLAVDNNLDLIAEALAVKSGHQEVLKRFSRLMPQVGSRIEGRVVDTNTAKAGFGFQPEKLIRSSFAVDQMLYNEQKISKFSIEQKLQKSREFNRKSLELDIILDTAIAYLTILRVKADILIAEENIHLSNANLRRAHELVDSGQARLSEVYRWESEVASNQDSLVALEAILQNIETEFNRLLNRPLRTPVVLQDINPFDTNILLDFGHLVPYLNTPDKFNRFKEHMLHAARENSPDIKSIDQEVQAEERHLVATKRAFYLPEFSAFGEFSNNLYRGGAGDSPPAGVSSGKLESRVGIALTYPLFTSGTRTSEKNKAFFDMQKIKTEKASLVERIDELVIQSISNMKASYEGIFLAQKASNAAGKNLVIVTNSYTRGIVSIVDLLDAQNKMIVSKQSYHNSLYDYLIDYMEFQRATSQYDFMMNQDEKEAYKEQLIKEISDET